MKHIVLLAALLLPPAHAQWGRLFFTPKERAEMTTGSRISSGAVQLEDKTPTSKAPTLHRFNGEAIRDQGGTPLRWMDGERSQTPLPAGIKPGEYWDARTGKVYPAGRSIGR